MPAPRRGQKEVRQSRVFGRMGWELFIMGLFKELHFVWYIYIKLNEIQVDAHKVMYGRTAQTVLQLCKSSAKSP